MVTVHTDFGVVEYLEWVSKGAGLRKEPDVDAGVVGSAEPNQATRTAVLLHSAASGPHSLTGLGRGLSAAGYRVLAPALHGYGATTVGDDQGEDDDVLARHLQVAKWSIDQCDNPLVIGHSMGGFVALQAAATCSVAKVVVYEPIVTGVLRLDDAGDRSVLAWDREIIETLGDAVANDRSEQGVAAFVEAWNGVEWRALPEGLRSHLVANADALARETHAISFADASFLSELGEGLRVGVWWGTDSPEVVRRICMRLVGRLPQCETAEFPEAGHMLPVEVPRRIVEQLKFA